MPRLLIALFLVSFRMVGGLVLSPNASVQVSSSPPKYSFGENITFQATIKASAPIQEATISFQPQGDDIRVGKMDVNNQGQAVYSYDASTHTIRPFSQIYYWIRVKLQGSQDEYTSPSFPFYYEDNRFDWQKLDDPVFEVHWYDGDQAFGQTVLNIAHEGLASAQNLVQLAYPSKLKVYVYPSALDLQQALQLGGKSWVAGHASPDLGVVMIYKHSGPEQKLELERDLPHELTHVLLYQQITGQGYAKIPAWLNEGLASLSELYANPDYARSLEVAKQKNSLLSMDSLCGSFPQDASGNFLAYAQASSFTRFLQKTYGTPALQSLITSYTNGLGCDEGARATYGASLRQLETRWQQETLGIDVGGLVLRNLLPYLILFALILIVPLSVGWILSRRKKETTAVPDPGVQL